MKQNKANVYCSGITKASLATVTLHFLWPRWTKCPLISVEVDKILFHLLGAPTWASKVRPEWQRFSALQRMKPGRISSSSMPFSLSLRFSPGVASSVSTSSLSRLSTSTVCQRNHYKWVSLLASSVSPYHYVNKTNPPDHYMTSFQVSYVLLSLHGHTIYVKLLHVHGVNANACILSFDSSMHKKRQCFTMDNVWVCSLTLLGIIISC